MVNKQSKRVVYLVDGDESYRAATCRLLEDAGFSTLSYATATAFLDVEDRPLRGCLVLEVSIPGGIGGLELQKEMNRRNESLPVIFLTGHGDIPISVKAIKAGALDFLTKPTRQEVLIHAVETAMAKELAIWDSRHQYEDRLDRLKSLTKCEREIFLHMMCGLANEQISEEVNSATSTVSGHRTKVMRKMGVTTDAQLIRQVHQLRLAMGDDSFPTVRSLFDN